MKKLFLIVFFTHLGFFVIGQVEQFESKSSIKEYKEPKLLNISRLLVFTDNSITISNWLNGGTEALKLKIDKIVDKDYSREGICKWYYCTSLKSDIFNGFFKAIIIVPKNKDKVWVNTFADEVSVNCTEILITKD